MYDIHVCANVWTIKCAKLVFTYLSKNIDPFKQTQKNEDPGQH